MKNKIYLLLIVLSVFSSKINAQISVSATTSCLADTLTAALTGLTPVDAGITADDGWSSVIPIGFTFNFYGVNYTQCIVGSNGELGFDVSYAGSYNTWPITSALLTDAGSGDIHNLIAGPWCDVYIPAGGTMMYSTVGTAPNRKFEVTYCGTRMYDCTTQWLTTQIIIYETSNLAEVHIGHHTFCTSWNGGYAEVGVKNNAGTSAVVAPGRNYPANWNATNEGWRFTPSGATYTCTSIPYAPIPYASSAVYWYDSATHAYLGSGTTLTVTPSVTTTYEACAVGCNDTSKAFITEAPVGTGSISGGVPHISAITYTNPICGAANGTITLHGIKPGQIDTVFETIGGVPQPPVVMTAAADSLLSFTGLGTGTYTFYVKVGLCPSNTVAVTLTTATLAISGITPTNPTLCGLCDGKLVIHGLWPGATANLTYDYNGQPQSYTGTVAPDSTITLSGLCAGYPMGNYNTFSVTIGSCNATFGLVTLTDPTIAAVQTDPTICGKNDGSITLFNLPADSTFVVNYTGSAPQIITVDAGDDSLKIPTLGGGTYNVTASIHTSQCSVTGVVLTNPPIAATFTNPTLCGRTDGTITLYNLPADSIFTVTFAGPGAGSGEHLKVNANDSLVIPALVAGTYPSPYTSIVATINGVQCPITTPITLMNPPIEATYTNPTICGKNDGTITLYNLPADSIFTVTFAGPGAGSGEHLTVNGNDSLVIPGLIAGAYPSPYTSIIATINGIQCPITESVILTDPSVSASFDTTVKLGCRGDQVTFLSTSTPVGYHNTWVFGDGGTTTTDNTSVVHLYNDYPADSGTYVVTLTYQTYPGNPACTVTKTEIVHFDHVIASNFSPTDTTICLQPTSPVPFLNHSYGTLLTYAWTFGDGTSSTDAFPIHTYNNGGIYQTSLTVTDYLGCDSTVFGSVDVIKVQIHTVTHDTTVCLVAPLELIAHPEYVPGTFTSIDYAWTPATNLKTYNDTIAYFWGVGLFQYTVTATTTPLGCQAIDTETIHSMPPIVLTNLTANQTIMYGSSIRLNAFGADYYEWFPADGSLTNNNINDPVGRPLDSTTYMIVGTSIYGCRDTGYITITLDDDNTPFIPSAFTPNNDGLNDKFRVINLKYDKLVELRVFDRWGVEMYRTSDGMEGWDGTFKGVPQDMGTYTYAVIISHVDGTNKTFTGTVTLIR